MLLAVVQSIGVLHKTQAVQVWHTFGANLSVRDILEFWRLGSWVNNDEPSLLVCLVEQQHPVDQGIASSACGKALLARLQRGEWSSWEVAFYSPALSSVLLEAVP